MWKLINKPKTSQVTKTLAKEFAEMDPAPNDRQLSERRLQVYARLLNEGSFRPVTWAMAWCEETESYYRVNGKHTSVLLSGLEVMPEFFATVEEYNCETLEDVARLYATFDSKMMSRTTGDINRSFAATVTELCELPARAINLAVTGLAINEWGIVGWQSHQPAERAEMLFDHTDFVVWLSGILNSGIVGGAIEGSGARHLCRTAVVAAMCGTWNKAKGQATEFWTAVRDETGSTPGLADRKLAKFLTTSSVSRGSGAGKVKKATDREFYVKCIHAWNAWRKNDTTNLNYYPDKDLPAIK